MTPMASVVRPVLAGPAAVLDHDRRADGDLQRAAADGRPGAGVEPHRGRDLGRDRDAAGRAPRRRAAWPGRRRPGGSARWPWRPSSPAGGRPALAQLSSPKASCREPESGRSPDSWAPPSPADVLDCGQVSRADRHRRHVGRGVDAVERGGRGLRRRRSPRRPPRSRCRAETLTRRRGTRRGARATGRAGASASRSRSCNMIHSRSTSATPGGAPSSRVASAASPVISVLSSWQRSQPASGAGHGRGRPCGSSTSRRSTGLGT